MIRSNKYLVVWQICKNKRLYFMHTQRLKYIMLKIYSKLTSHLTVFIENGYITGI